VAAAPPAAGVWDNYVVVKGHQKIGYFTLSYTDMTIPISVIRTYHRRCRRANTLYSQARDKYFRFCKQEMNSSGGL